MGTKPYKKDHQEILRIIRVTHVTPAEILRDLIRKGLAELHREERLRARGIDPARKDPLREETQAVTALTEEIQALRQELGLVTHQGSPREPSPLAAGIASAAAQAGPSGLAQADLEKAVATAVEQVTADLRKTLSEMAAEASTQAAETAKLHDQLVSLFQVTAGAQVIAEEILKQTVGYLFNQTLSDAAGNRLDPTASAGGSAQFLAGISAAIQKRADAMAHAFIARRRAAMTGE